MLNSIPPGFAAIGVCSSRELAGIKVIIGVGLPTIFNSTCVRQHCSLSPACGMERDRIDHDDVVEETTLPLESGHARRSRAAVHAWEPLSTAADDDRSIAHEWRHLLRRLCARATWIAALKMQALVVRNAAGSIACAWIPNAFYALGNIFSGKWYTEQSRNELLVANSVYASITFCAVVFTSFMPMMLSLQYSDIPGRRPTVWFCVKKLTRATGVYFVASVGIMFAISSLVAYATSVEPGVFKYKIDCYVDSLTLLIYFTGISQAVKNIYYEQTRQGQDRLHHQELKHKSRRSKIAPAALAVHPAANKTSSRACKPNFWRAYIKGLPGATPPLVASLFVHVLSRQRIVDRGNLVLSSFVAAGIVFKLAIQELAKHYIFKKRVRSARVMCVLVGIPTVLIDTQTRIILLGTNSTQTAVMGALGMALVEITLRAGKAVLVMWEIHHRKRAHKRRTAPTLHRRVILSMFTSHTGAKSVAQAPNAGARPSLPSGLSEFELWRRQAQAFHTAELNADMYAEYISIGCSASILFFYGNHPHYSLLRQSASADTVDVDVASWRLSQLRMLVLQIGVEIGVDYVSIVLEMVIGIEFNHVKNLGAFLAALFMVAAVMNITISIGFYLS
jgi:hypothetical protein